MKPVLKFLFILVAMAWSVSATLAEEAIERFDMALSLARDGGITVTETITVRGEGQQIRRGIYRDFPVVFKDATGRERKVDFEVVSVSRDGKPEDFRVERAWRATPRLHRQRRQAARARHLHLQADLQDRPADPLLRHPR